MLARAACVGQGLPAASPARCRGSGCPALPVQPVANAATPGTYKCTYPAFPFPFKDSAGCLQLVGGETKPVSRACTGAG